MVLVQIKDVLLFCVCGPGLRSGGWKLSLRQEWDEERRGGGQTSELTLTQPPSDTTITRAARVGGTDDGNTSRAKKMSQVFCSFLTNLNMKRKMIQQLLEVEVLKAGV